MTFQPERIAVVILLAIFVAGCNERESAVLNSSAQAQKPLRFHTTSIDIGETSEDRVVEFKFTNQSDFPVKIVDVMTSCACTVPEKQSTPIAPGETRSMPVSVDLTKREYGMHRFQLVVRYKAEKTYVESCDITAFLARDFLLVPSSLSSVVIGNETRDMEFELVNFSERNIPVTELEVSGEAARLVKISSPTHFDAGWHHRFRLRIDGKKLSEGKQVLDLKIGFDDHIFASFDAKAEITRLNRFILRTERKQRAEAIDQIVLHVRDRLGENIQLGDIEFARPGVQYELVSPADSGYCQIIFSPDRNFDDSVPVSCNLSIIEPCPSSQTIPLEF